MWTENWMKQLNNYLININIADYRGVRPQTSTLNYTIKISEVWEARLVSSYVIYIKTCRIYCAFQNIT